MLVVLYFYILLHIYNAHLCWCKVVRYLFSSSCFSIWFWILISILFSFSCVFFCIFQRAHIHTQREVMAVVPLWKELFPPTSVSPSCFLAIVLFIHIYSKVSLSVCCFGRLIIMHGYYTTSLSDFCSSWFCFPTCSFFFTFLFYHYLISNFILEKMYLVLSILVFSTFNSCNFGVLFCVTRLLLQFFFVTFLNLAKNLKSLPTYSHSDSCPARGFPSRVL